MLTDLLLFLGMLLTAASAHAQDGPGTLERTIPQFEPQPADRRSKVDAPTTPPQAGSQIAESFILGAVNIEGATVFSSEELAKIFEPYLASRVGQAELDKITAEITQLYRDAGYPLSYAVLPEQSVQSGIVRIRVVEGFVGNIRLVGKMRIATAVRGIFERLTSERPLRGETLERAIGLARDVPGVVVSDVRIERAPRDPARHQLTITVGAARFSALAYTDNRGTIENARMRAYSSFSLSLLAVPGDRLQVDLFTIPYDRFRYGYGQVKASIPLNSDGLRITGAASYGDQHQRITAHQDGYSRQFSGELTYPFAKSRALSILGSLMLADWKNEQDHAGTVIQRDRIQVVRAWVEVTRVTDVRLGGKIGISRGVDFGPATNRGDPLASRPFASSKFTKFNASFDLTARLFDRARLRLEASAQYATEPLLAPEEYALGGSRIGRAFDFNELTGDHGVGAMAELALPLGDSKQGPKAMEVFAYADGGGAFRKRSSPSLPRKQWLASAGAGARFSALGVFWSGEFGIPVARSDADRGIRAFFSATRVF